MIKRFVGEIHVDNQELGMEVAKALETCGTCYDIEVYGVDERFDSLKRTDTGRVAIKVFKME